MNNTIAATPSCLHDSFSSPSMDDRSSSWPFWKFGLRKDDLFCSLHDQFNTFQLPIQDPEAFHHDVFELAHEAASKDEFYQLLAVRKEDRLRELHNSLESTSLEIISNPSLIGTDQWQYAVQLFRTKSLDSLVRYFASYLPGDHPWYRPGHDGDADAVPDREPAADAMRKRDSSASDALPLSPASLASVEMPLSPNSPSLSTLSGSSGPSSVNSDDDFDDEFEQHHDFSPRRSPSFTESAPDLDAEYRADDDDIANLKTAFQAFDPAGLPASFNEPLLAFSGDDDDRQKHDDQFKSDNWNVPSWLPSKRAASVINCETPSAADSVPTSMTQIADRLTSSGSDSELATVSVTPSFVPVQDESVPSDSFLRESGSPAPAARSTPPVDLSSMFNCLNDSTALELLSMARRRRNSSPARSASTSYTGDGMGATTASMLNPPLVFGACSAPAAGSGLFFGSGSAASCAGAYGSGSSTGGSRPASFCSLPSPLSGSVVGMRILRSKSGCGMARNNLGNGERARARLHRRLSRRC